MEQKSRELLLCPLTRRSMERPFGAVTYNCSEAAALSQQQGFPSPWSEVSLSCRCLPGPAQTQLGLCLAQREQSGVDSVLFARFASSEAALRAAELRASPRLCWEKMFTTALQCWEYESCSRHCRPQEWSRPPAQTCLVWQE